MKKAEINDIDINKLTNRINEVRVTLNQVCCTLDENKEVILNISEYLDKLIVEYMEQTDNKSEFI
jgi:hypothetical protein